MSSREHSGHVPDAPKQQAPPRQQEQVKMALFESIGHDLMTRLTVIQAAASNLKSLSLSADDRIEQSDLILGEAKRLRRLFKIIVEMLFVEGAPTLPQPRWAVPSEIIAAAQHQIEGILEQHRVVVAVDSDAPVHLDPRLTAKALAHLLENAAQYAPLGSSIRIDTHETKDAFEITVADRGPGIAPVDLPHVFDRCYRGIAGRSRVSGTGMGLWIARELLAASGGRVSVANRPCGGSVFTIIVPTSLESDVDGRVR
jgi:two-component system, OmpR family, sensor histidine kinase KdpD